MLNRIAVLIFALALAILPAAAQLANNVIVPLGNFQIGAAGPQIGIPQLNLQGLTALSCQVRFAYGSGGTKTNVYIQTSLDGGFSWFDISNTAFTTSSGLEAVNLSGLNSVATPTVLTNLTLADNTTLNGPLGDRLQAVIVSTGTYGGGTLVSVNCAPR